MLEVGRHDHMRVTSSSWYDDSVTAGWPFLPFLSFQSNPQQFYFLLGRVSSAANPTHSPFLLKTILLTRKSFVNERQHKNPRTQKQTEREREMPINSSLLFHSLPVKRNIIPFSWCTSVLKKSMSRSSSDQSSCFNGPRHVAKRLLAKPQHEGEGAVVRRSIGRLLFFHWID